jgi:hypothetical protein
MPRGDDYLYKLFDSFPEDGIDVSFSSLRCQTTYLFFVLVLRDARVFDGFDVGLFVFDVKQEGNDEEDGGGNHFAFVIAKKQLCQ